MSTTVQSKTATASNDGESWLIQPDGYPYCAVCQGARFVRRPPQPGEIVGHLVPCPKCGAIFQRERRARAYAAQMARIERYLQSTNRAGGLYDRQTFATFQLDGRSPHVRAAYLAAHTFAQHPKGFLVLAGTKGVGKTHLAAAVDHYQRALPEGDQRTSLFFVVPDLFDLLRSGYGVGDYDQLLLLCREVEVLILDDLGAEQGTAWEQEKLFQILNHRYYQLLPTLVVTNCPLKALDPRIYSRLSDTDVSRVLYVVAPDYRQRQTNPETVVY